MPAKGVNTRTVASSSHTSRPVSGTNAGCSAPTGSTVSAANCGELVAMMTVSPTTLASAVDAAWSFELQPASTTDRPSRLAYLNGFMIVCSPRISMIVGDQNRLLPAKRLPRLPGSSHLLVEPPEPTGQGIQRQQATEKLRHPGANATARQNWSLRLFGSRALRIMGLPCARDAHVTGSSNRYNLCTGGAQDLKGGPSADGPRSPVLRRRASRTGRTNTLPSPAWPVWPAE